MKLAVIGAGYMADIIIKRAKSMGITTYCFAWEKGAVAKASADYFYPVSVTEKEAIADYCRDIGVDGVVAAASVSIPAAAYACEQLGLPGNPLEVATNIRKKDYVRRKTRDIPGLAQVRYEVLSDIGEFEKGAWDYPIIIKPTDSGGKDGVIIADSAEDLEEAFRYAKNGHNNLIVESYIGGREYSVESLSYQGQHYVIQVTEKDNSGSPHFVELAHHQPASLSDDIRARIESVIGQILSAVGIQNGPCHTEIKINNGDIYLIEVNGRLGGDHISYPLTELSSGYPYITGVIQAALGCLEPVVLDRTRKAFASVFFVTKQTEYLKPLFDVCQDEDWCYEKHKASDELVLLQQNNGFRINYFIYYSEKEPPVFIRDIKMHQEQVN